MASFNFFAPRTKQNKIVEKEKIEKERKTQYDKNKRNRSFQQNWLNEFPWLRFDDLECLYNETSKQQIQKILNKVKQERSKSEEETDAEIEKVMTCNFCRKKHYETNHLSTDYVPSVSEYKQYPFIFGAISFRIESIRKHCKSSNVQHDLAVLRHTNLAKEKSNVLSDAQKVQASLAEKQKANLKLLFLNVYGVLKNGKPFSEYEFLVALDKAKGVDIGSTYLSRQAGVEFGKAIGDVFLKDFREHFFRAKFFSIIMDESTDSNRLEQCVLYLRYAINTVVYTRFVAIDNVIRPNAQQLTDLVLSMLKNEMSWEPPKQLPHTIDAVIEDEVQEEELEMYARAHFSESENVDFLGFESDGEDELLFDQMVDETRMTPVQLDSTQPLMVGITTDGASVLTGRRNGVQKRIKDLCNPNLTATHCLSHRLQLALKDAAEEIKILKDLQLFCEQLFVFHKTSSVVSAVYRNACTILGVKGIKILVSYII